MSEKRYHGNRYVHCYCEQDKDILVGSKMFAVLNPLGFIFSMAVVVWVLQTPADWMTKTGITLVLGVSWWVMIFVNYYYSKKTLLDAGHTVMCSRKIGLIALLHSSLWSDFKIMKEKDDGKRLWW